MSGETEIRSSFLLPTRLIIFNVCFSKVTQNSVSKMSAFFSNLTLICPENIFEFCTSAQNQVVKKS